MKTPQDRTLEAALTLARVGGWRAVTRDAVAAEAGVATGSVNHYWGTIDELRAAAMDAAREAQLVIGW